MSVLISGGAGYIGSHAARMFAREGYDVWVYDNLSTGHPQAALPGRLVEGELADRQRLVATMRDKEVTAVIHFAAFALVGESVADPAKYYQNNVAATFSLMEAMREAGVARMVFSSTTATYGVPESIPITEDEVQHPINPYGFTKMVIEQMLRDYAHAYGWSYAALRYFNAAGASPDGDLGEDHTPESHLIPLVLQVALGQRDQISIFGDDYPTADGTCIRDYIHVDDLVTAHAMALDALKDGDQRAYNLGIGRAYSVRDVIESTQRVTGIEVPVQIGTRRPGDPSQLCANPEKARCELGWSAQLTDLDAIIETAWKWFRRYPDGYARKAR